MKGGFTFCGVDITDIGLEYAPDLNQTYVYRPADVSIHEENFESNDGGYFYGANKKPKEFVLRCFFEEKAIDRGLMTYIYSLFKVGKTGKLVFKRKPWCYYYATVINSPAPDLRNYLNGLFTVTMKAYYPFARCDSMVSHRVLPLSDITPADKSHFDVMQNTALFETDEMVPQTLYENVSYMPPFILANPGTERAAVCVKIAGDVGDGLSIKNLTTGQTCFIRNITKEITTNQNRFLMVDALNGNTVLTDGQTSKYAFIHHDKGFIELEPAYPCIRNIYVQHTGNTVTSVKRIYEDVVGKYIYLNNGWHRITSQQDTQTFTINESITNGTETTTIMFMNEMRISPVSTIDLSTLEFVYKPTFS